MERQVFHVEARFKGRVQGVGFRFQTLHVARGYEVAGTVQNLPDGDVLLHAEGAEREVSEFFDAVCCEMKAFIKDVEKKTFFAPACARGFRIIP
ncbi:MAG: acylphosphatase [Opitutae bacterium]|nr:acylphosphatase [Opitutae bacterium]MCD8298444.1 acylphosphatase [Opitutae bacterium]